MDKDQKIIKEILAMDDAALSDGIMRVAAGMGVDPALAGRYLTNMEKIRQTVAGLTPMDLEQIRKNLGDEKVDGIISEIQKNLGDK